MVDYRIRPVIDEDKEWITNFLTERWGSPIIITRGKIHHGNQLSGFVAEDKNEKIGLITYDIENEKFSFDYYNY